jgi:transposase
VIQVAPGTKVYLACRPVSMRYGFDGLAAQVANVLAADPFCGHVFVFRSKKADYFKILHWDGSGLCLFAKRLEVGKFVWPPITDAIWPRNEPLYCTAGFCMIRHVPGERTPPHRPG